MNVYIDSDVLLDVLLNRSQFFDDSSKILDWAEEHPGNCAVSWHSLANIHYLSKDGARSFIRELLEFCVIPASGTIQMLQSLDLEFNDLEDAMQVPSALLFEAQIICTRNAADYKKSPIKALSPKDLASTLCP
jgi:predicted nucleic acid-binding protein